MKFIPFSKTKLITRYIYKNYLKVFRRNYNSYLVELTFPVDSFEANNTLERRQMYILRAYVCVYTYVASISFVIPKVKYYHKTNVRGRFLLSSLSVLFTFNVLRLVCNLLTGRKNTKWRKCTGIVAIKKSDMTTKNNTCKPRHEK